MADNADGLKMSGCFLLFTVLYTPIGCMIDGFTGMKLWGWFVAPTFGLPQLTIAAALGIALLTRFWSYHISFADVAAETDLKEQKGEFVPSVARMGAQLVIAATALLLGYIFHLFM